MNKRLVVVGVVLGLLISIGLFHQLKPLPAGLSFQGEEVFVSESDIELLIDDTYVSNNTQVYDHELFDRKISLVANDQEVAHVNMFLFNSYPPDNYTRTLTAELTDAITLSSAPHRSFVTDPINTVYGGVIHEPLVRMNQSGVDVLVTDLSVLRDSNLLYSPVYRTFFSWLSNQQGGWLPSVLSEDRVSLRSYLRLLNFKANHRKVFLADEQESFVSIISSANAHDASSAHSNVGLLVRSDTFAHDVWSSEQVLVDSLPEPRRITPTSNTSTLVSVQLVTEGAIKDSVLATLASAGPGDVVELGMFYLSDREIIQALVDASLRGAQVQVVLDPSKDAFGSEKSGVPNRQAAWDLVRLSEEAVSVRWFDTRGEQFHSKFLAVHYSDGSSTLILGSANYTRRNLDDYNLETNVVVQAATNTSVIASQREYFSRVWNNIDGQRTVGYEAYADESHWRYFVYRVQELLGLGTF